jgi:hypothetical protein
LRQPFWLDEAWVAASTRYPLSQLPALTSSTPIGWTALVRLITVRGEQTSRLLPLAFAGAAVAIAYWFGRRLGWRRHVVAVLGGFLTGTSVLLVPAMGLTILVRIDGASDILPVIPFCGALFVRRGPQAVPLSIGLATGVAIGLTEGLMFSWTYLMYTNGNVMLPLAGIAVLVLAATAAGTLYYRHRRLPRWWGWLTTRHWPPRSSSSRPSGSGRTYSTGIRRAWTAAWCEPMPRSPCTG